MIMPTPEQTRIAIATAAALDRAARGTGTALVGVAAAQAGCSVQTLYTWMRPYRTTARKRRCDYVAGTVPAAAPADELILSRAEADLIAAAMVESTRANAKQILSLKRAVATLRRDGHIVAAPVDPTTGELGQPLSDSAISRALYRYGCHPAQLTRPTAHQPKRSLHPNHEWQVDASVCVVYYLPGGGTGIVETDQAVHYKNKPDNVAAIERFRVIRYVLTDHTTGYVRWRYYPHAESGAHTVAFLAWAMAPKPDVLTDPFQGAPTQLVVDPGATASGTVQRFCDRLQVELIVTRRKNPRAKGSVENANNLVETYFESGLRYQRQRVTDFGDLNRLAAQAQAEFNATQIHTRHGRTRMAAWLTIAPGQLRLTQDERALRALATESPAKPKVRGDLTIAYKRGDIAHWKVDRVPGANVGDTLAVLWSPLLGADGQGQAVAVTTDPATGRETYHPLEPVRLDDWGFQADAPVSGERYARHADTAVERTAKRLTRLASGTTTEGADETARRHADFRPLAHLDEGRGFNPFRAAEEAAANPVSYLPRRGVEHRADAAPAVAERVLDLVAAAQALRAAVVGAGGDWGPERFAWLAARYPDGVPEGAVRVLAEELLTAAAPVVQPVRLRAV